ACTFKPSCLGENGCSSSPSARKFTTARNRSSASCWISSSLGCGPTVTSSLIWIAFDNTADIAGPLLFDTDPPVLSPTLVAENAWRKHGGGSRWRAASLHPSLAGPDVPRGRGIPDRSVRRA